MWTQRAGRRAARCPRTRAHDEDGGLEEALLALHAHGRDQQLPRIPRDLSFGGWMDRWMEGRKEGRKEGG